MSSHYPLLAAYSSIEKWQVSLYKDLHGAPEISLQEVATAQRIEDELARLGLQSQRIGETGIVVTIENGAGAHVLARADTDALPVTEATGLDYASENEGVMHACGHDGHVAALLGAVRLLVENKQSWSGTYTALFQPGEELAAGAQKMIDDGLTDKIARPDVVLGQHLMVDRAGDIKTMEGVALSAGDSIEITVHGRGAHGSMPHNSVDPVVLASSIVMRLQSVVSREIAPGTFAVVTVGAINAGSKSNIIPASATLLVNVRTYDEQVRAQVLDAIQRIVRAECEAAASPKEPEFKFYDQYPLTFNDAATTQKVTAAFTDYFGEGRVQPGQPVTASEDFSLIPQAFGVPYTYWFVGCTDPDVWEKAQTAGTVAQDIPANHNPGFAPVPQPTLQTATEAQVLAALAYFEG